MAIAGDHVAVLLDSQAFEKGTILSVDIQQTYGLEDMTSGSEATKRYIRTLQDPQVTLKGYLTTTATNGTHTLLEPLYHDGSVATLTLRIGENAPPDASQGYLQFSGAYLVGSYTIALSNKGAVMFTAKFMPVGQAPTWTTVSPTP